MYIPEWNDELQKQAEDISKRFNIFLNSTVCYIREEEYPIQE